MPVTVDTSMPLDDDRERPWDGDAAAAAMADHCTDDDQELVASCYGNAFLWRDPDAPATNKTAYRFGVADVIDGRPRLIWRGVTAAAAALRGARTPTTIPQADQDRMRSALNAIYARFADEFDDDQIVPPWQNTTASAEPEPTPPNPEPSDPQNGDDAGCGGECGCRDGSRTDATATVPAPRRIVASAQGPWAPPPEHFSNPHLEPGAKVRVDDDGRVVGYLAEWGQPHIGFRGEEIYAPRDPEGGRYQLFRRSEVACADGSTVACGLLTMSTGHARDGVAADAAMAHYDDTGTIGAAVNVGEDDNGIWMSGSVLPDVDDAARTRMGLANVSGDWRSPRPGRPMELVAVLSVPVPGFPVVKPADQLTLAASGAVAELSRDADGRDASLIITRPAANAPTLHELVAAAVADGVAADRDAQAAQAAADQAAAARHARASSAVVACAAARSRARSRRARRASSRLKAAASGDDDGERRGVVAAPTDAAVGWIDRPGTNWVEQVGGLPRAIKNVAKHLMAKGYTRGRAIPIAVNVIKKWCRGGAGGDPTDNLNWPGRQNASLATRVRGCAAMAEWIAKRARARAD